MKERGATDRETAASWWRVAAVPAACGVVTAVCSGGGESGSRGGRRN
ncbi:hypothetical protein A2U01_0046959 [Trifolium medium]|uniref:Uncharacterized protein n=1 Tax=Trifolium medium TaxID=97028 RepID=A0A392QNF8_9FABA|nr:hypothetical protein [Trifolium medium]